MFLKYSAQAMPILATYNPAGNIVIKASALGENLGDDFRSHIVEQKDPRFVYAIARAVTADVPNKNHDMFPLDEIKRAYTTFIGRNIFLDHNTKSVRNAVGKIIAAELREDEEGHTYVACLFKVDRELHPDIARKIENGIIDSVSMGANVAEAQCSQCGQRASREADFCDHLRAPYMYPDVYSINHGVEFTELSLVSVPADPTAHMHKVFNMQGGMEKVAVAPSPATDLSPAAGGQDPITQNDIPFNEVTTQKVENPEVDTKVITPDPTSIKGNNKYYQIDCSSNDTADLIYNILSPYINKGIEELVITGRGISVVFEDSVKDVETFLGECIKMFGLLLGKGVINPVTASLLESALHKEAEKSLTNSFSVGDATVTLKVTTSRLKTNKNEPAYTTNISVSVPSGKSSELKNALKKALVDSLGEDKIAHGSGSAIGVRGYSYRDAFELANAAMEKILAGKSFDDLVAMSSSSVTDKKQKNKNKEISLTDADKETIRDFKEIFDDLEGFFTEDDVKESLEDYGPDFLNNVINILKKDESLKKEILTKVEEKLGKDNFIAQLINNNVPAESANQEDKKDSFYTSNVETGKGSGDLRDLGLNKEETTLEEQKAIAEEANKQIQKLQEQPKNTEEKPTTETKETVEETQNIPETVAEQVEEVKETVDKVQKPAVLMPLLKNVLKLVRTKAPQLKDWLYNKISELNQNLKETDLQSELELNQVFKDALYAYYEPKNREEFIEASDFLSMLEPVTYNKFERINYPLIQKFKDKYGEVPTPADISIYKKLIYLGTDTPEGKEFIEQVTQGFGDSAKTMDLPNSYYNEIQKYLENSVANLDLEPEVKETNLKVWEKYIREGLRNAPDDVRQNLEMILSNAFRTPEQINLKDTGDDVTLTLAMSALFKNGFNALDGNNIYTKDIIEKAKKELDKEYQAIIAESDDKDEMAGIVNDLRTKGIDGLTGEDQAKIANNANQNETPNLYKVQDVINDTISTYVFGDLTDTKTEDTQKEHSDKQTEQSKEEPKDPATKEKAEKVVESVKEKANEAKEKVKDVESLDGQTFDFAGIGTVTFSNVLIDGLDFKALNKRYLESSGKFSWFAFRENINALREAAHAARKVLDFFDKEADHGSDLTTTFDAHIEKPEDPNTKIRLFYDATFSVTKPTSGKYTGKASIVKGSFGDITTTATGETPGIVLKELLNTLDKQFVEKHKQSSEPAKENTPEQNQEAKQENTPVQDQTQNTETDQATNDSTAKPSDRFMQPGK